MQMVACRSLTHLEPGYYDQAIAGLRRCVELGREDPIAVAFLAYSLAVAMQPAEAQQLLASLLERAALAESTHPSRLHLHSTASELGRSFSPTSRTTSGGSATS